MKMILEILKWIVLVIATIILGGLFLAQCFFILYGLYLLTKKETWKKIFDGLEISIMTFFILLFGQILGKSIIKFFKNDK